MQAVKGGIPELFVAVINTETLELFGHLSVLSESRIERFHIRIGEMLADDVAHKFPCKLPTGLILSREERCRPFVRPSCDDILVHGNDDLLLPREPFLGISFYNKGGISKAFSFSESELGDQRIELVGLRDLEGEVVIKFKGCPSEIIGRHVAKDHAESLAPLPFVRRKIWCRTMFNKVTQIRIYDLRVFSLNVHRVSFAVGMVYKFLILMKGG